MSNDAPMSVATRRRDRRRTQTVGKLLDAAVEELRETSFANMTLRAVAARAGVSTASAYNHFASKNALVAEVYLRLLRGVPVFNDVNMSTTSRVTAQLRAMVLVVTDDLKAAASYTGALMSDDDPAAQPTREKVAHEMAWRISAALGPGWPPAVESTLQMLFAGALTVGGSGFFSYAEMADRLEQSVALVLASHSGPP